MPGGLKTGNASPTMFQLPPNIEYQAIKLGAAPEGVGEVDSGSGVTCSPRGPINSRLKILPGVHYYSCQAAAARHLLPRLDSQ
jgi:hypothetical protein